VARNADGRYVDALTFFTPGERRALLGPTAGETA
jgi:hypothetical protein